MSIKVIFENNRFLKTFNFNSINLNRGCRILIVFKINGFIENKFFIIFLKIICLFENNLFLIQSTGISCFYANGKFNIKF